ncbi:MAG: hypothetical protein CK545_05315 [Actinobacteria bacterium]|nr:MAG: hypothetical protein CK545_05315 [Actinomycetota bacterium]
MKVRCVRNLIASLGVVVMNFFLTPFQAHAHAELIGSIPAASSHVSILPTKIVLLFGENLSDLAGANAVIVTDSSGEEISNGQSKVSASSLTRELNSSTAVGAYHVDFRVLSEDGHPVAGQFDFFLGGIEDVDTSTLVVNSDELPAQKSFFTVHTKHLSIVSIVVLSVGIWVLFESQARRRRSSM